MSVAGRVAEIVRRAGTDAHPIVRLAGIADRTAAEALRGLALSVAEAQVPALGDGEWWAHELEGCEVRDGARVLGTVVRMLELPSCEALEVRLQPSGEPLLVPMVKDAIRKVDAAARRIEVDARFLDLDAPEQAGVEPARADASAATEAVSGVDRPRAASRRSSVEIDVFTLFPEWFEWFGAQRHVRNVLDAGSS